MSIKSTSFSTEITMKTVEMRVYAEGKVSEHMKHGTFTLARVQSLSGIVGKYVGINVAVIQEAIRYHPRGTYVL